MLLAPAPLELFTRYALEQFNSSFYFSLLSAVSLLIYYLFTYYFNIWFLLNILWMQIIDKLAALSMQHGPEYH